MDMTQPWKETNMASKAHSDEQYHEEKDALYIFTDGSVNESMAGGYGYHMILSQDYHRIVEGLKIASDEEEQDLDELREIQQERYKEQVEYLDILRYDRAQWLSDRCSIDFCEAYAIRDSLIRITYELREKCKQSKDRDYVRNLGINKVKIISDSLTVLNWIDGSYTIRNPVMKGVIDDIIWQMACLKDDHPGLQVKIQWVKAHEGTYGNEEADKLAKEGMEEVLKDKDWNYDRWSWYSLRAAKRTVLRGARLSMAREMREAIQNSEYSGLWRQYLLNNKEETENPIKWQRKFKKELSMYSRDQIRLLIGIRSGHLKLNEYMCNRLNRTNSPNCRYCNKIENMQHLLLDCKQPDRVEQKRHLIQVSQELYEQRYQELIEEYELVPLWKPHDIDYEDVYMYIFGSRLDPYRQYQMMKELINLVRISVNNNQWSM